MTDSKTNIVFRCDGNAEIGLGHLYRCIALAEFLKEDFTINFVLNRMEFDVRSIFGDFVVIYELNCSSLDRELHEFKAILKKEDIVVLDGYNFDFSYQKDLKKSVKKLVLIDDLKNQNQVADVILNHGCGITSLDYDSGVKSKLYLGLDYLMIRKPFFSNRVKSFIEKDIKIITIAMGGSDIDNHSQKIVDVLLDNYDFDEIHVLIGEVNKSQFSHNLGDTAKRIILHQRLNADAICTLLERSDLMICAASGASLEACAYGIPLIILKTAENQDANFRGLIKSGAALGTSSSIKFYRSLLLENLTLLNKDLRLRKEMIGSQAKLIDGKSPDRLKSIFKKLQL